MPLVSDDPSAEFMGYVNLISAPDQELLRKAQAHCMANGHLLERSPELAILDDTPDRGRYVAKCSKSHAKNPGEYGPGALCAFVSDVLPEEDLGYMRSLNVSPKDLMQYQEATQASLQSHHIESSKDGTAAFDHQRQQFVRDKYTTVIPSHRHRRSDGSRVRRGNNMPRPISPSTGAGKMFVPSPRSIIPGPRQPVRPIPFQIEVRFFFHKDRAPTSIFLPVGSQDDFVWMSDHGTHWKTYDIGFDEIILVLVVDQSTFLPAWAPVRLGDWVSAVRPEPVVAKHYGIEPAPEQMLEVYRHAYRGSLTSIV
ncbi:unnamed protein product [Peniophora sp. CBMAI 1063]|nr:unnamed protein product [Peniophora sp. CBMAI 1063]